MNIGDKIGLKDEEENEIRIGDKLLMKEHFGYWAKIEIIWKNYAVAALYGDTNNGNMEGMNHIVYLHDIFNNNSNWKFLKIN